MPGYGKFLPWHRGHNAAGWYDAVDAEESFHILHSFERIQTWTFFWILGWKTLLEIFLSFFPMVRKESSLQASHWFQSFHPESFEKEEHHVWSPHCIIEQKVQSWEALGEERDWSCLQVMEKEVWTAEAVNRRPRSQSQRWKRNHQLKTALGEIEQAEHASSSAFDRIYSFPL